MKAFQILVKTKSGDLFLGKPWTEETCLEGDTVQSCYDNIIKIAGKAVKAESFEFTGENDSYHVIRGEAIERISVNILEE